ncbi:hypothetical protein FOZ61_010247 [Perkinsus olseni]|uniref:Transmembrane protein 135 n=1 Tax=Perkinsus olseni TaxID=32597 RepID=A0A7J6MGZ7_PEROL|nr:hypothetical protein FOZ61_010247 [Perkinsus olseni]KAF4670251.1 hypothetical protein FOL46_000949 [Perkinsus olseni]
MAFPPPGGMAPSLFPAPHQWGMDFNVMSAITGELRRLPPIPEESALSSSRSASQTLVDWAERTLAPEWKDLEDECWSTDCSGGDLWEDPRVAPQELRRNGGPLTIVRTHPRDRGDRSRSLGGARPWHDAPELYPTLEHCAFRNFVKGAAVASGAMALSAAIPSLLRGQSVGRLAGIGRALFHPSHVRCGIFFGGLVSTTNTLLYLAGSAKRRHQLAWLVGLLSGPWLLALSDSTQYYVAVFVLVRTVYGLAELGSREASALSNRAVAVATSACAVARILWCWRNKREELDPQLVEFIVRRFSSLVNTPPPGVLPVVTSFTNALKESFLALIPTYLLPRLVVSAVRVQLREIMDKESFVGLLRSSAFLATFITALRVGASHIWLGSLAAGSLLLLEQPYRRQELAIFLLAQAVHSVGVCRRLLGPVPRTTIFSICLAICIHFYVNEPRAVPPGYLFLMRRFFDSGKRRHLPLAPLLPKQKMQEELMTRGIPRHEA